MAKTKRVAHAQAHDQAHAAMLQRITQRRHAIFKQKIIPSKEAVALRQDAIRRFLAQSAPAPAAPAPAAPAAPAHQLTLPGSWLNPHLFSFSVTFQSAPVVTHKIKTTAESSTAESSTAESSTAESSTAESSTAKSSTAETTIGELFDYTESWRANKERLPNGTFRYVQKAVQKEVQEVVANEVEAKKVAAVKVGRAMRVRVILPPCEQPSALYNSAMDVGTDVNQISVCEWAGYSACVREQVITKNIFFLSKIKL
jgi:hypothetical protein